jgi:hypothetical protein
VVKRTYYLTEEQDKKLKAMALAKGYIVLRGKGAGGGCVGKLLQALADGELTAIKLGRK